MIDRQAESERARARVVPPIAPLGRVAFGGLVAIGLLSAASRVLGGKAAESSMVLGIDAARIVLGCTVAGWLVWRILAEAGGWADRMEERVASGLDRVVSAFESAQIGGGSGVDPIAARVAEIRQAVRDAEWQQARSLLIAFREAFPDRPEPDRIGGELEEAERVTREELTARVAAARAVNDPERVIDLRGQIGPLLEGEPLRALDRDLAKWFLHLIHRRLRTGTARVDVAVLAARVAQTLDDTPEGASLRASLPTLRRAAGLCPRCGEPYKGLANACPACLGTPLAAVPFVPADEDDDLEAIEHVDEFGIGQIGD